MTAARQLGIELQGGASVGGNGVGLGRVNFRNLNPLTSASQRQRLGGLGSLSGLLGALISNQSIVLLRRHQGAGRRRAAQRARGRHRRQHALGAEHPHHRQRGSRDRRRPERARSSPAARPTRPTSSTPSARSSARDVGITLRLTPQISEGDMVRLLIFQEVSALVPTSQVQVLQLGPTTTVRSATTTVVVKDSQTVVIGGLISDTLTRQRAGRALPLRHPGARQPLQVRRQVEGEDQPDHPSHAADPAQPARCCVDLDRRGARPLPSRPSWARKRASRAPWARSIRAPPRGGGRAARAIRAGVLLPAENGGGAAPAADTEDDGMLLAPEGETLPPGVQ